MNPIGPIGEAVLLARKLQAQGAAVSDAVALAFRDASDSELARSVIAALVRVVSESASKSVAGSPGSEQWFPYHLLFNPVVLSAATLRAAKVVEGASGTGVAVGMPRRANDFPEVTPLGLRIFYLASLGHSKDGGPSFTGLEKILYALGVSQDGAAGTKEPSLADSLLLMLIPDFGSHKKVVLPGVDPFDAEMMHEVFDMAEILSGLRAGKLPSIFPARGKRLAEALLSAESLHGMFQSGLRTHIRNAGAAESWPTFIESFLVRPTGKDDLTASPDTPLLICALAANWIRLTYGSLSPDRKGVVLADFKALVARCDHSQAEALEASLNRAIA
jgi:hypothetical protein